MSSYFLKGGHSATQTEQKKYELAKSETSPNLLHEKQATANHNKTTALERSVINNWGLKLVLQAHIRSQFLKWYNTLCWLFGKTNLKTYYHENVLIQPKKHQASTEYIYIFFLALLFVFFFLCVLPKYISTSILILSSCLTASISTGVAFFSTWHKREKNELFC